MTAWMGHRDGCTCSYCERLNKLALKRDRRRRAPIKKHIVGVVKTNLAERPVSSSTEGRAESSARIPILVKTDDSKDDGTPKLECGDVAASLNHSGAVRQTAMEEDALRSQTRHDTVEARNGNQAPSARELFPDFDRSLLKAYPCVRGGKQVRLNFNLEIVGFYE